MEPISSFDPILSGIGRNFEIGCKATGFGTRALFWPKLIKTTILSLENCVKSYFEEILSVALYSYIGVASTSTIPPSVKGKEKV